MRRVELKELREDLVDVWRELRDLLTKYGVKRRKERFFELSHDDPRAVANADVRHKRSDRFEHVVVKGRVGRVALRRWRRASEKERERGM